MKVIVTNSYDETCAVIANMIKELVNAKPDAKLGLATGGTPVPIYKKLIEMNKAGEVDFSRVLTVNLDEYCGIPGTHDQSYRYFMDTNLFDHININKENTSVPCGTAEDLQAECERYEQLVEQTGGVDIQLLGIGNNGHIAFNEPCEEFPEKTHVVDLTQNTIEANARFFESMDQVPKKALTMGIGTIMKAKKIVLLANGPKKAQTIYDTVYGPITPKVPASVLRLHPDVTIFVDEEAGALLKK